MAEVGFKSLPAQRMSFAPPSDESITRAVIAEVPVAFEYDGFGYAVMMATPIDLEDFAVGFTLSERLVTSKDEIADIHLAEVEQGRVLRIALKGGPRTDLQQRIRLRVAEGSCGLCGVETIEQALRPLPQLSPVTPIAREAIHAALQAIGDNQCLGRATGAAHAAAFCNAKGIVALIREDVGRHNALDKLIGAAALAEIDLSAGFLLLTARCSYELVEKAAVAGCPVLVTISAPTTLAVERAQSCGMTLISLAREDSMLCFSDDNGKIG